MAYSSISNGQHEDPAVKKSLGFSIRDGVAYAATVGFGDNYINPYAVALGASNFQIGLLSFFTQLVSSLTYLRAADITERIGSRKKIIVLFVFFQAFILLPIALIPFFPGYTHIYLLICFCTLYLSFSSFANPAWGSLMANLVPEKSRGAFFSKRGRLIGMVTVASSFLAGYVLQVFEKCSLAGFTVIFSVAMFSRYISCFFLNKMYEPPLEIKKEHYFSFKEFVQRLNVGNFGKYVIFHSSFNFAVFLASPFFPVFMLRDMGFSYITYSIVTTTVPLASMLAVSYWGRRADMIGNRQILQICGLVISVLPAMWLISRNVYFLLVIQSLAGVFWAGFNLCSSNFMYDSVIPEKRTRVISYFHTFNGLAVCVGTFLGGFLATHIPPVFGHRLLTLFAVSSLLRVLVSTLLFRRVKEVRKIVIHPR